MMFSLGYLIYRLVMCLVVGGVAGFLASRFMGMQGGMAFNIGVGVIGSVVGGFVCNLLGFSAWGFIANIIVAFIGSCLFLWVVNKLFSR